ncbi:multidrug MFS transporter [Ktedonobacter sp. SOSP1-85]|uniref:epoxide hydrolase family protein n=1 Tax=Ktedonobacter sp. SOSP1-85 TaxID=2778367 RepID=UPI0019163989|nr:epoxide hydrolase family protein [Ktedonobacter sp. SOSP1-85]GHO79006.1 multidrug MFS transporter [Ktedonobacter sp. SOSP1-85]
MSIQTFKIAIPQAVLDDLQERLARTRWPDEVEGAGWDYGTNLAYLKELVDYWRNEYDWRAHEAKLNSFAQFRTEIDGLGIHFIHERGKGPNPIPLLLTHGWPDSFYRFHKIIPLLTDPASHGGDPADAFDVIVPSLPGFGFSDRPRKSGMTKAQTAELWASLMKSVLGYNQYMAAGGDFGSGITQTLALAHPEAVAGIHVTDLGFYNLHTDQQELTPAEKQYLGAQQGWFFREGAYGMIQGTKPQTLAYGLNDSPVGLAGWIVEKFRAWSDCDGNVEHSFSKDELLTNIMIYWVTQTINSSFAYYRDMNTPALQPGQHIEVPAAFARFPRDIPGVNPPRELAERHLRIQHWTQMPRGGHFAALEEPELLAEDLRASFRPFREA